MRIKTGCYFIINVQTHNRAYLPNSNSDEPVQSRYKQKNLGEQWNVIDRENRHHSIVNIGHKQFAASGSRSPAGELVKGHEKDQTWLIQKTTGKGQYTISTTDTKKFWGLPDGEQGTPITLADGATDPRNWWMFKDVETGDDAEVDPDLDNGRTAYDRAVDDMMIQAVFLELALPPPFRPKPFKLDLVVIQQKPNKFIRNATETANKICSPLIKSGQLNPSNLRIKFVEFESFENVSRQRFSLVQTFDQLRNYRGSDFPWVQCPGPVIPSSLITIMNGFQLSATKVVVLNLGYVPLQNGGQERLRRLIDRMIEQNIILILTLSEPHLTHTLFDTDLLRELARLSSGSIISLPTDGGGLYPCLIDYLQNFDTDAIVAKFSDVVTINPEIHLRQRVRPGGIIQERPTELRVVILRLQVLCCTNMLAKDRGGTSDPYVIASLLDSTNTLINSHRTPVAKQTVNPVYAAKDATFDFRISLADRLGAIKLIVWDQDTFTPGDYLGEIALPLEDWFNDRDFPFNHPGNTPFTLEMTSTRAGMSAAGRIQIKMGFALTSSNHLMDFDEIYRQLIKRSQSSLVPSVGGPIVGLDDQMISTTAQRRPLL